MKFSSHISIVIFFLMILTILAASRPSFAFRCGNTLVSVGATKHEVVKKCGEPDYADSWLEERIARDYPSAYEYQLKSPYFRRYRDPLLLKEYVTIDFWTYNLGPNRFIRYLTFENGFLIDITMGDRGY